MTNNSTIKDQAKFALNIFKNARMSEEQVKAYRELCAELGLKPLR